MTLRRVLEAPISDLTFEDIEALIQEEAEEGPRFELKRSLPANDKQQTDPWMQGGRKIGNPARDGLAKEVVAFANAYGGVVVVGVDETDDHPRRARGPAPFLIPDVADCAERLMQALDSLIDPPLSVLEIRGIPKPEAEGHGVLVIRTGPSTRAPHGHGKPPLAYMRRGSRSEPMTMRDLQGALFETRSRGERISALLEQRRDVLKHLIDKGPHGIVINDEKPFTGLGVIYFRCTLVSAENLQLHATKLAKESRLLRPTLGGVYSTAAFGSGTFNYGWKPKLKGIESEDHSRRHFARWFVGDHGIIDTYGFMALDHYKSYNNAFAPSLFPPVAVQVLALGEMLRRMARRPEVELIVECEFFTLGTATAIHGIGSGFETGTLIPEGVTRIGPFLFGNVTDYKAVYAEIERGIWNSLGLHVEQPLSFDVQQWLADVSGP